MLYDWIGAIWCFCLVGQLIFKGLLSEPLALSRLLAAPLAYFPDEQSKD